MSAESETISVKNPLLVARGLNVVFEKRRRFQKHSSKVHAVAGVDLEVGARQTVGLVGESGSGKSTLARAICGLVPYTGQVEINGRPMSSFVGRAGAREVAQLRSIVFQDPYSSLNPTMTVHELIAEPILAIGGERAQLSHRIPELLEAVRLPASFAGRLPSELSGGQRQRVAIARAIAVEPPLVICDEAISALDVSTQREVLDVIRNLKVERGLAFLFIAHDLAVVRNIADRVAVMYFGRLMEEGPTDRVFRRPIHPYTQALLAAVPVPNPRVQRARERIVVSGELPDPTNPPTGCVFHPRCPHAMDVCRTEVPAHVRFEGGVDAACHLYDERFSSAAPQNFRPNHAVVDSSSMDRSAI